MMNLSKKTFVYSAIVSGIIVSLLVAYFVLMLPSLYVDYMKKQNFKSIKTIQENYLKDGDYHNITSPNPTGTLTIKIPAGGNDIFLSNKLFSVKATIKDNKLLKVLEKVRYYSTHRDEIKKIDKNNFELTNDFADVADDFKNKLFKDSLPVNIEILTSENKNIYKEESTKVNIVSDNTMIYEFEVFDGTNYYTNYIAMSLDNNDIIVSMLTIMTPKIQEIKPIIFQSLPMIVATSFLLILISAILFSRKIVVPIEKLVNHAVLIKDNTNLDFEPMKIEGHDEIALLGLTLNDLYLKLNENFMELEEKNNSLAEQNKRQEVFLRTSSHQLKTPVAAALLLVDGMINEIGKYKNTKEHLPKVKIQLQSMRKIIDDILNLNSTIESVKMEDIDLCEVIDEILIFHEVQIKAKELHIEKGNSYLTLKTDRILIYKIIDNLISNAINYTPKEEAIKISLSERSLTITNYGAHIDSELLPHIFEPFVSSSSENRGHGLGLYIIAYYAKVLNYEVNIKNIDNGVEGSLYFTNINEC